MSRPESMATGGYFPMPADLVPRVAALLRFDEPIVDEDGDAESREWALVDPCAADGKAALALSDLLDKSREDLTVHRYFVELEAVRFAALDKASPYGTKRVRGDAFRLEWERGERLGASLLFLNPPYDEGRLEARWLLRFADCLAPSGVLVFVIPSSALEAVAGVLAQHFEGVVGYRFPGEHFRAFRQVVLFARRRPPLLAPDSALLARIATWAADPMLLAELPDAGPARFTVPSFPDDDAGFSTWQIAPLDLVALTSLARPWRRTDRRGRIAPFPAALPPGGAAMLHARTFPVAMPLGEGHVPAALACGVMNGARLAPDDPATGLPDVYAKAVFRKRWKTADTRSDKDGHVVGEIQVEQPELSLTVLDLESRTFHTPRSSAEKTDATALTDMTAADVLVRYRTSFRAVLKSRCPALHDPDEPTHALALPTLARRLFTAQAEVTRAIVKLLGTEGAALLLGEVGVGKSTVALAVAAAIHARRVLVVCPPHLLDSWQTQARAVLPDARATVLADVADVDDFARDEADGLVIGILAQTAGKLSHAWAGVGDSEPHAYARVEGPASEEVARHRAAFLDHRHARRCPRCGEPPIELPDELARERIRCGYTPLVFHGPTGELTHALAVALLPVFVDEAAIAELFPRRWERQLAQRFAATLTNDPVAREVRWEKLVRAGTLTALVRSVVRLALDPDASTNAARAALPPLLAALQDDALTAEAARAIYTASIADSAWRGAEADARTYARRLLLLLPPGSPTQASLGAELIALGANDNLCGTSAWDEWHVKVAELQGTANRVHRDSSYEGLQKHAGLLHYGQLPLGAARLALQAFTALRAATDVDHGPPCGEPLFQAVPRPRRVPLASYLVKRHPHLIDLAVIDEAHECANADSAQSQAMAQFMGTKMLLLTGSVSNGYALGLFAILWTISKKFRDEFPRERSAEHRAGAVRSRSRDARTDFARTYGYARRYVDLRGGDDEDDVTGFGANSDRIERRRTMGFAPGVLPSLLLKHLLPVAVVLHMEDLHVDLPPRSEHVVVVDPGEDLGQRVRALRSRLVAQIKSDRFSPLTGKLFGAMADEWSSADRASMGIGNSPDGIYRVTYPESVGGAVVAALEPTLSDDVLPKERQLVDILRGELAEDRATLVFVWHADCGLQARLARVIEAELGEPCPILHADKVPAKKREAWIEREILAKHRRLLIVNPVAVGTGLNVLTHFSSLVWFQPPGCLPKAMRQAEGRVYRIGQTRPTRIYWLLYGATSQEILHRLLLLKVAESVAVDGLDPASALQASGVGTPEGMSGFDVGRAIFEAVQEDEQTRSSPLHGSFRPHTSEPAAAVVMQGAPVVMSAAAASTQTEAVSSPTQPRVILLHLRRAPHAAQLAWGW